MKIAIIVDRWGIYRDIIRGKLLDHLKTIPDTEFLLLTNQRCAIKGHDLEKLAPVRTRVVDFSPGGRWANLSYALDKVCHKIARDLLIAENPHITLGQTRRHRLLLRGKIPWLHTGYARLLKLLGLRWYHITALASLWGSYPEFVSVLEEEKPDSIVYSNMMIGQMDGLREARRRAIPTILDIPSWDQVTSKGPLTVRPDYILTWGDEMKKDTVKIHSFSEDRVLMTGALYFDSYFQKPDLWTRQELCERCGIDPSHKIIVYSLSRVRQDECTVLFIDLLYEMIRDSRLGFPVHLIVRASPLDDLAVFQKLSKRKDVTIQCPSGHFDENGKNWLPDEEEQIQRMSTIVHADVMVMIQSTMILDSCFLGRPVVTLAYDAGQDLPWHRSIARFFDYQHAHSFQEEGSTTTVRSDDELRKALIDYCNDPGLHAENRKNLIPRILNEADGKCYQRWTEAILHLTKKHSSNA